MFERQNFESDRFLNALVVDIGKYNDSFVNFTVVKSVINVVSDASCVFKCRVAYGEEFFFNRNVVSFEKFRGGFSEGNDFFVELSTLWL